jgi:hypothetical protein
MVFIIAFLSTKAFAIDSATSSIFTPIISEDFDLSKFAGTVVGWIMAFIVALLWVFTRLLSFVFKFAGGLMYGFFINNPLDTEIAYIKPLWSFLVDVGNLVVIASFIALALVILFDINLPVSKDLGKFAGGIVMIALLLNFSLTFTSAFASTVHSIGIGTVYATQGKNGTNLDLSSKSAFNKSVLKTGTSFFDTVNNNFVESVSCLGNGKVQYIDPVKNEKVSKPMSTICQWHGDEKIQTLDPISLIVASNGTPEAFTFYLIALVREVAVLILLGVGIFVLIKLVKVGVFRLAYLWIVGIFAGPALVAAFSPFDGLKKYFDTWLKWLIVFSTMMIVFVGGFYLSSYVATITIPASTATIIKIDDPLKDPSGFVSSLVSGMTDVVVPNIMFPIIGIAILFLLGKYLDETYQQQAEKALKAGGKLISQARNTVGNVARTGAGVAGFGGRAALGGVKNVGNLRANTSAAISTGYLKANSALAAGQRMSGNERGALNSDARATKYAGKAAVSKQIALNRKQKIDDFVSGKEYKDKRAEVEYLGRANNAEVLGRLGVSSATMEAEAKKKGVSADVINKGKAIAHNLKYGNEEGGNGADFRQRSVELERKEAMSANRKNFDSQFAATQAQLIQDTEDQRDLADITYKRNLQEYRRETDAERKDIEAKIAIANSASYAGDAKEKQRILSTQATRQSKIDAREQKLNQEKIDTQAEIEKMRFKIEESKEDNTVVTDVVNKKFLAENDNVKKDIAKKIYRQEKQFVNTGDSIRARREVAEDQYTQIEGQASAIYQQMKEIDKDSQLSKNEKKTKKDNLLNTIASGKQEVRKIAERKYKESGSNIYGEE